MNMETKQTAVRVVLADNQEVARLGTREVLERADDIALVAETGSGEEALRLSRERTPDVLVTEMAMPNLSGIQLAVQLADAPVRMLVFTAFENMQYVRHLLQNGIDGYLKKQEDVRYLSEAVWALAHGEKRWVSPHIAQRVMELKQQKDALALLSECGMTPRERDVVHCMAEGMNNEQIAETLYISKNTVRTHVSRVYAKLDLHSRAAVMMWARKHAFLEAHELKK